MATKGERTNQNLTDHRVKSLKAGPANYRVFDSQIAGFHVIVTKTGVKSFRVQFERKGVKVSATLGAFPAWDVDKARSRAGKLRQLFDDGHDIRAYLQEQREGKDLSALVDLWREEYSADLKPLTLKGYESVLKATVLPRLGSRLVKDLTYTDIRKFYNEVKKKTPVRANRSIAMLSKLFNIAEKEGWRPAGVNPCRQIDQIAEKPRKRVLSVEELRILEESMINLIENGYKGKSTKGKIQFMDPMIADLVRFLAYSGLRRGEALGLKWTDIDLEQNVMRFEEHKTDQHGDKVLPLNTALRAILESRAKSKITKFVFPGLNADAAFQGFGKWWSRIKEASKLPNFTPHDLRRTFNSTCAGLGFPPQAFDLLLGHRLGGVKDTYTILGAGIGLLAQASEDTAAWIHAAIHGKNPKPGEKIVKGQDQKNA